MAKNQNRRTRVHKLAKVLTGIQGLDEVTRGGLPAGRPTLVSGSAGSGKTLFGLEFLVRGATQYGEPGVFVSFEESISDLATNAASLGFDLKRLVAQKKLFLDHVQLPRTEMAATGEFDLDGLFIRIADAIQRVSAPNASCSIRSKSSSARCPIRASCAPKSGGCLDGSKSED